MCGISTRCAAASPWAVPKLDRGFRDLEDFCKQLKFFIRNKINIIIGDIPNMDVHTPAGRMCLQMMAMFAEFERQRISERTKIGLAKRRDLGLPTNGSVSRGYSLACIACNHVYPYFKGGTACSHCKIPRKGNTREIPNPFEQQIMWRLLWERSAYFWKDWDQVVSDLNQDGIRTRQGRTVNRNWARADFNDAVELLSEEKLLHEHRPPKMENFSIHKIPHVPRKIAEKLEAKSRELGDK